MSRKVKILGYASRNITTFYQNVRKSNPHTYSREQMKNNIREIKASISQIENGLSGKVILKDKIRSVVSNPISGIQYKVQRCNVRRMQWHFIYYIENDTICIVNAIHGQNMKEYITENRDSKNLPEIQAILNLEQRMNNLYTQSH